MPEVTRQRVGVLIRKLFEILLPHPEGAVEEWREVLGHQVPHARQIAQELLPPRSSLRGGHRDGGFPKPTRGVC